MKVIHLVVFLPPALGAYVLSQHRTKVPSSLCSADEAVKIRRDIANVANAMTVGTEGTESL